MMSSQTRADSWKEAWLNFGLTVVIGTTIWYEVILRLERTWGWYDVTTAGGAVVTTVIYTVASVLRRYAVRRHARCGQTRTGSWAEAAFTTSLFMLAAWGVWMLAVAPMVDAGWLDRNEHGFLINAIIAASMIPLGFSIRRAFVLYSRSAL